MTEGKGIVSKESMTLVQRYLRSLRDSSDESARTSFDQLLSRLSDLQREYIHLLLDHPKVGATYLKNVSEGAITAKTRVEQAFMRVFPLVFLMARARSGLDSSATYLWRFALQETELPMSHILRNLEWMQDLEFKNFSDL